MSSKLNIGGDPNDPSYHYKMYPLIIFKSGRETILVNVQSIAKQLDTHPSYIVEFCAIEQASIGAYDETKRNGKICGNHEKETLQACVFKFIQEFALCCQCRLPELQHKIKHEQQELYQRCNACGWKGPNPSTHLAKQYIIRHPTANAKSTDKSGKKFLSACINFKSVSENFDLFFHGFMVMANVSRTRLELIPMDVICLTLNVCYDQRTFKQCSNDWDREASVESNGTQDTAVIRNPIFGKTRRNIYVFEVVKISPGFEINITDNKQSTMQLLGIENEEDEYGLVKHGGIIKILVMYGMANEPLIKLEINDRLCVTSVGTQLSTPWKYRLTLSLLRDDQVRLLSTCR